MSIQNSTTTPPVLTRLLERRRFDAAVSEAALALQRDRFGGQPGPTPRLRRPWLALGGQVRLAALRGSSPAPSLRCVFKTSEYAALETRALEELHRSLPAAQRARIPRLLGYWPSAQLMALEQLPGSNLGVLTIAAASPLGALLRPTTRRALQQVGSWLGALSRTTSRHRLCRDAVAAELRHRVEGVAALGAHERARVTSRFEELLGSVGELRSVVTHGDFAPRNVLWDGRVARVVDWAMCSMQGRPAGYDGWFFATTLARRAFDPFVRAPMLEAFTSAWQTAEPLEPRASEIARLLAVATVADRETKRRRREGRTSTSSYQRWLLSQLREP